jgi:2-polyprenyl-3-methyl-5-hydroxy-6-metoxy-1,4-benzoquinol methylase
MYTKDKNGNLKLDKLVDIDYVDYWGKDKSTFDDQKINVNGIKDSKGRTKIEAVLQYVKGDSLLEIACCPGELLRVAKERGFKKVFGVAPEKEYIEQLKKETGAEIFEGFFEDFTTKDKFDTIVAMDLFDHIEDGQKFIDKCKKLLKKDGVIILMLPLIKDGEELDKIHYNPEHVWLYNIDYIKSWLKPKKIDKWLNGHDIVVI